MATDDKTNAAPTADDIAAQEAADLAKKQADDDAAKAAANVEQKQADADAAKTAADQAEADKAEAVAKAVAVKAEADAKAEADRVAKLAEETAGPRHMIASETFNFCFAGHILTFVKDVLHKDIEPALQRALIEAKALVKFL